MVFKSCLFVIYFPTYDLAAAYLDGQYQASLIKTNKRLIVFVGLIHSPNRNKDRMRLPSSMTVALSHAVA